MKKRLLVVLPLLMVTIFCGAQIRENNRVKIEIPGNSVIAINFYDAEMLSTEGGKSSKDCQIDSVSVKIISPKVTEELNSEGLNSVCTSTRFKSKNLKFIVSRKGYKTLEEEWKVTSMSTVLDVFLTKEN